jgi:benzoyl-CoA reductase/2-hydroxyglutaryl-CoA dehydratase subunit BcrC/BadD/HgdB
MDDVCGTGILPVSFDAVVLATTCDQMRRAGEMLSPSLAMPAFLMNVPATWQSPAAAQMYQDELRRLGRFLVHVGGKAPSDSVLLETMLAYQNARQALLKCQDGLSARRFVELIFQLCQSSPAELCSTGILPVSSVSSSSSSVSSPVSSVPRLEQQDTCLSHAKATATNSSRKQQRHGQDAHATHGQDARATLAVVGGPMTARDLCVLDMIEQGGGRIVLNASESGQRCLPGVWNGNRGQTPISQTKSTSVPDFPVPDFPDSPLTTLAAAYFGAIPDAFRRPDDLLHEYLRRELAARPVRGIVFVRQAWCDLWHAQASRIRAAFDLPLLDLDVSCPDSASANLSNRIQSFMEVLR